VTFAISGKSRLPTTRIDSDEGARESHAGERIYVPLAAFLVAMLFPCYWMAITSIKPNHELYNQRIMPLIVHQPTLRRRPHRGLGQELTSGSGERAGDPALLEAGACGTLFGSTFATIAYVP